MALIECRFFSRTLGNTATLAAIVPERARPPHRVLWLMHGLGDDHTAWTRMTNLERHLAGRDDDARGLAVVMPAVGRSFYTDMQRGLRYWTYIADELPAVAAHLFPLSAARDDNFLAGQSMGGYGAIKLALRRPDRFAAAASLSGALDVAAVYRHHTDHFERQELANIFGSELAIHASDNDLFHLAAKLAAAADSSPRPRLWLACGKSDFLALHSRRFDEHLTELGLEHEYHEHADRDHSWAYWDEQVPAILDWLVG